MIKVLIMILNHRYLRMTNDVYYCQHFLTGTIDDIMVMVKNGYLMVMLNSWFLKPAIAYDATNQVPVRFMIRCLFLA